MYKCSSFLGNKQSDDNTAGHIYLCYSLNKDTKPYEIGTTVGESSECKQQNWILESSINQVVRKIKQRQTTKKRSDFGCCPSFSAATFSVLKCSFN